MQRLEAIRLTPQQRKAKLKALVETEGESLSTILERGLTDGIGAAICVNQRCNYVQDMEPDQDRGWCPECSDQSMQSALMLRGLI